MDRLEYLAQRVEDLESALLDARREYHDAIKATHRWQPGTVIRSADGAEAKVTSLHVRYGVVHVIAVLRKKDGSWGLKQVPFWRREWSTATIVGEAA